MASVSAQQEWVNVTGPGDGSWSGAYDVRRGRFVRFPFGAESVVWEHDGSSWVALSGGVPPFGAPAPRSDFGSTFDVASGKVLLFGGRAQSTFGDMWSWDGRAWEQVATAVGPARRRAPAMAFDSGTGRVMLFGGVDGTTVLGDTWDFDGTQWTQLSSTGPGSTSPQMVYDEQANRMVLVSSSTQVWNGSSWVSLAALTTTDSTRLCYDRSLQRVLCYATVGANGVLRELVGNIWVQAFAGAEPSFRATMWFDPRRGRTVLASQVTLAERWTWDGAQMVREAVTEPPPRAGHAWFDDPVRNRLVLFGGTVQGAVDDTWTWDGIDWTLESPAASPPPCISMAFTSVPSTGQGLMFGGSTSSGFLGELWGYDGTTWTQLSTTGPSARVLASLSHDSVRNRTVLFGGVGLGLQRDTWEWDGAVWLQRTPATAPPAAIASGMAFDPLRGRTVLYLGQLSPAETWEWDGTSWQQNPTAGGAPLTMATSLAWDASVGRIAMVGSVRNAGTWDYDGVSWTQRPVTNDFYNEYAPRLAFDSTRQRLVVADGHAVHQLHGVPPAVLSYGAGCGLPLSILMPRGRAVVGHPRFGLDAAFEPAQLAVLGLAGSAANAPLGNGCALLVGTLFEARIAVTDADGLARWDLPVPASPALVGGVLWAQAGAVAPLAPGGIRTTQGLQITLGE
ncbi:MAG: hypothetical protein AB7O97_18830 [Planctomycetota bacterium]